MTGHYFYAIAENTLQRYLDHHISRASAGLSFFLMLTIFPLLICLYAMLGSHFPSGEELESILEGILPAEALETIMDYIGYVSANAGLRMISVALVAMATSSAAGFRIIDNLMFELRGTKRKERVFAFMFSFVFSLLFLAALYVCIILIAGGGWFINLADKYIDFLNISRSWRWIRFVTLFLLLFVMITGVYRVTAPRDREVILVPGAFFGTMALVIVSAVFSGFISLSVKYPLVYGSLASVMILLFWLYICGNLLFLGNILNISLEEIKK